MNENLVESTQASINIPVLDYAEGYRLLNPTKEDVINGVGIDEDETNELSNFIEHSGFDNDIRAYALLQYFGMNMGTTEADISRVKDIYNWIQDGTTEVFGLVDSIKAIELKVGNPLGQDKLGKVWYYLALDSQEKDARNKKLSLKDVETSNNLR